MLAPYCQALFQLQFKIANLLDVREVMNLLWLGDPQTFDARLVGGKAANLSRLARLNHRVPDGFCLPVTLVEHVHSHDLQDEISRAISDLMACHNLSDFAAAVRSSATGEDGNIASYAGQYESFLNVVGPEDILRAVQKCWDSVYSKRVLAYHDQRGQSTTKIQMGVLVHQLIKADVSAVAFSVNPINGKQDEILINASWGLGESLVGGTVTPDTFVIKKTGLSILERTISDKQRMTIPVPGGTREADVPLFLRDEPSLPGEKAVEIAHLTREVESTLGYPVDLECSFAGEELFLLQCRPITTIYLGKTKSSTLE
jgi:phosphoenolpyruvate synthase/pyruvate phosphate dikinase